VVKAERFIAPLHSPSFLLYVFYHSKLCDTIYYRRSCPIVDRRSRGGAKKNCPLPFLQELIWLVILKGTGHLKGRLFFFGFYFSEKTSLKIRSSLSPEEQEGCNK